MSNNEDNGIVAWAQGNNLGALIANSTIYGNGKAGVLVQAAGSEVVANVTITDSIVSRSATVGIQADEVDGAVIDLVVSNCDVWKNGLDFMGVEPNPGCISTNPEFVDAPADLRLRSSSACIDALMETSPLPRDLLGRMRPQGAGTDIGTYEFYPGDDALAPNDANGGQAGESGDSSPSGGGFFSAYRSPGSGSDCGCRLAGSRESGSLPLLAFALGLGTSWRLRRRRAR